MRSTLAVLAMASLLTAACNSTQTADTIPSSDDVVAPVTTAQPATTQPVTTQPVTTAGQLSFEQASLEFTECMREQGVDLPDLRLDAEGRPVFDEILEQIDIESTEFAEALTVCSEVLTRSGALDLSTDPELQAIMIDQLQSFSECMRAEGVDGFPDPAPGFSGTGPPFALGMIPFDDPEFEAAATACQAQLGEIGLGQ